VRDGSILQHPGVIPSRGSEMNELKNAPEILKAVTDPFSLLALMVLVLGFVAYPIIKAGKAAHKTSTSPLVALLIVTTAFLALAFNVIRVTALQKPSSVSRSGDKFIVQATFLGTKKRKEIIIVPFRNSSGQLNVGCGESATTSVSWNVPAGALEPPNARASWEVTDNLKSQDQRVSVQGDSASGYIVIATGTIGGQDRQWTGNCPGGGHGQLVLSGEYRSDQEAPDEQVRIGESLANISKGEDAVFDIPSSPGVAPSVCKVLVTSSTTNFVGPLNLKFSAGQTGQLTIAEYTPPESKIEARVADGKLMIRIP
jgi:hypothetical protein